MWSRLVWLMMVLALVSLTSCALLPRDVPTNPAVQAQEAPRQEFDDKIERYSKELFEEGRKIFRYDTFGSEAFWGDKLRLHEAIAGEKLGGVGPGISPRQALQLGLKVDTGAIPEALVEVIKGGSISLDEPKTTLELLKANAVVGVSGFFDEQGQLRSVGIQCAFCHSTVDDSLSPGIGRRLDGWPNRDLDVGAIIASAPNLQPISDITGMKVPQLRELLLSWGPGRYDAELNHDGKAYRPDGKPSTTVLPAAFGLAGMNLHTYGAWGGVPYWNAYVAITQMYGKGTFFDPRLKDPKRYPVSVKAGWWNVRGNPDLVTSKLPALQYYQLSIPAPTPPRGSFDEQAALRGKELFNGKAACAVCHVPPLFSEPGYGTHTGEEIGIDNFHADRSPDRLHRTTPLKGLFVRAKGGFYHDGRFPDLHAVVNHYNTLRKLNLTDNEMNDLVEYLKSI